MKRTTLSCLTGMASFLVFVAAMMSRNSSADPDAWKRKLFAPKAIGSGLPREWKVIRDFPSTMPKGGPSHGHSGLVLPHTADDLVRRSDLVVVGIAAGNDGGFYLEEANSRAPRLQYTTYYLKVVGYMKDRTAKRSAYLRILAPGGFLDGGQTGGEGTPFPYLEEGKRYLLYLVANNGVAWGNTSIVPQDQMPIIGTPEDYWTTGEINGRWYEKDKGQPNAGVLVGHVGDPWTWHGFGAGLPFGKAVERVLQAVNREMRGQAPATPRLPEERGILQPAYRKALLEQKAQEESQRRN
jgi:hypothetical protein